MHEGSVWPKRQWLVNHGLKAIGFVGVDRKHCRAMRFRWRSLALVALIFVTLKVFLPDLFPGRRSAAPRKHASMSRVSDSNSSPETVEPFAGSDIVVFQPSSVDSLWLQAFNGASYQVGVKYEWVPQDAESLQLSDPSNSVTSVTGLQSAAPGVYNIELTVCSTVGMSIVAIHCASCCGLG